jgi:ornithine cyclodeaminase/alanine dehydrogenase-like protein (mu-crystallin family)
VISNHSDNALGSIALIDADAVHRALSMADCIELMDQTMRTVSQDGATLPLRTVMTIPGTQNRLGIMPGHLAEPAGLGVKIVGLYPKNPAQGRSSHLGVVILFDVDTSVPLALLDAGAITALRTAAASAVATRALARTDAGDLAILGAGEQAAYHLRAMALVRPLRRVRIWNRSRTHAERLRAQLGNSLPCPIEIADDVESAVAGADLICATTAATSPVLKGDWIAPGTHINLVGASVQTAAEITPNAVARSRYFVDYRPSALAQAGELHNAIQAGLIGPDHIRAEIGEVLLGLSAGRTASEEITIYKSLGIAAQDIAAAKWIYDRRLHDRQRHDPDNPKGE